MKIGIFHKKAFFHITNENSLSPSLHMYVYICVCVMKKKLLEFSFETIEIIIQISNSSAFSLLKFINLKISI